MTLAVKDFSGRFTCSCKGTVYPKGTGRRAQQDLNDSAWPSWPQGPALLVLCGLQQQVHGREQLLRKMSSTDVHYLGLGEVLAWSGAGSFCGKETGFINQKETIFLVAAARKMSKWGVKQRKLWGHQQSRPEGHGTLTLLLARRKETPSFSSSSLPGLTCWQGDSVCLKRIKVLAQTEGFEKVGLETWKKEHATVGGEGAGLGRPRAHVACIAVETVPDRFRPHWSSHNPEEVEMKLLHHKETGGTGA